MKKCIAVLLLFASSVFAQTTTVTIPTTVSLSGVDRPGTNVEALADYGVGQLLKNLNFANYGYFAPAIFRVAQYCASGGTTNTTTSWYENVTDGSGYPANFWVGATYRAISGSGTLLGTGTITASTANTGSSGTTFTLGTALSAACNPSNSDVLIVDLLSNTSSLVSANTLVGTHCSGCSVETTDLDAASTNTVQAISLSNGGELQLGFDAGYADYANGGSNNYWVNANGTGYTATYKAKCTGTSGSISLYVGRSTNYVSSPDTLTCNATAGAGWQTFTHSFNPADTGAQTQNFAYSLTCTSSGGSCLIQDQDIIEPSVYSGNTTPYRDAVFRKLKAENYGSLRFMGIEDWCSSAQSEWAAIGMRSSCNDNKYTSNSLNSPPVGFDAKLQLAYALGADAHLTLGNYWTGAEMTYHINELGNTQCSICTTGQTWNSLFAAKGLRIFNEFGNESWNTATQVYLPAQEYGYLVKQEIAAAKAATGYNSSVDKLVVDGWGITSQSQGGGWTAAVMTEIGCTTSAPTLCPDYMDYAPYTLNNFSATTNSYGSGATAVTQDEAAEIITNDSTSSTSTEYNMKLAQSYLQTHYGVNALVYEYSYSPTSQYIGNTTSFSITSNVVTFQTGSQSLVAGDLVQVTGLTYGTYLNGIELTVLSTGLSSTQFEANFTHANVSSTTDAGSLFSYIPLTMLNQVTGGVGFAVNNAESAILMQRDSLIPGPLHFFGFGGDTTGLGTVGSSWNGERYLASGPGQLGSWNDASNAVDIAYSTVNNALGTNNNLLTSSQSGTPTFNYPGGQNGNIVANSAVPYVNCAAYANSAQTSVSIVCFNNDQTATHPVAFTGALAPLSSTSVTRTVFGVGAGNAVGDNNTNLAITNNATTPTVAVPSGSTSTGLNSDTLPMGPTIVTYTYSLSSSIQPAAVLSNGTLSNASIQ